MKVVTICSPNKRSSWMFKLPMALIGTVLLGEMLVAPSSNAADLPTRHPTAELPARRLDGICPCYTYTVRHRVMFSTYGASFDPNNYDMTEPHYFLGPYKTFRRYTNEPIY
jgi:hypothetical protein